MTRRTLALLALSASLIAASDALLAQPSTTPIIGRLVYRIDARPPEEVFRDGFTHSAPAAGTLPNYDILDHALGLICRHGQPSPWISTTRRGSEVNGFLANQIRLEHPPSSPIESWVYTIETDGSYLDVESVIRQVIEAGQQGQYGYGSRHVQRLGQLLNSTAIRDRAEVLTLHIAPQRIMSASSMRLRANGGAEWGAPRNNPNYRQLPPHSDNQLPALTETVPPHSHGFDPIAAMPPAFSCFLTCDGTSASQRIKRSASETTQELGYCRVYPSRIQAFIGSED